MTATVLTIGDVPATVLTLDARIPVTVLTVDLLQSIAGEPGGPLFDDPSNMPWM